jgi:D-beta-D-heptose 7-phosphate kinase/D-beta-D-heptose 1-phosphate adenosyltransferase
MDDLAALVESLPSPRVLVIGDMILDTYVEGKARRVSPEAPVLVLETESKRDRLGGACNVAANLASLGANAAVLGVIGDDVAGEVLLQQLAERGIDGSKAVRDGSRPTTRKTRYVSRTVQVLRVDEESRAPIVPAVEQAVLDVLAERPFPFDAVLLSDYRKGLLTPKVIQAAIAAARSVGGIVVADPKGADYSIYRGVDLITPNRQEAEAATGIAIHGLEDLHRVAAELRRITGVRTPTVTLGEDGIFFETDNGEFRIIPTEARSVFDVTGAGDTVVATLTLARAAGVPLRQSLHLANVAAGIVVAHVGTWAVSRQEILALLGKRDPRKILTREEAVAAASRIRAEGHRLVFTNGCFDLLHPGHTDYLTLARSYGDALMVAVNSDASVQRQGKGPRRPVNTLEDRMAVLAALAAVDYVVPFDADTPLELIKELTPHVLVKGEDWRNKGVVGREWVESHGGQVVLVALRQGASTTSIIERILGARDGAVTD